MGTILVVHDELNSLELSIFKKDDKSKPELRYFPIPVSLDEEKTGCPSALQEAVLFCTPPCCSPRQYCPLPESHHTHVDPIDGLSSVDHDELAQRALVLVSRDDDVVHASPPNHNRNGLVGYSGNGLEKSYELE